MADAVLLSGDEDLRVGVQQAQEFGVRVHLLGIKPSRGSQSLLLLQESDTTHEWDEATVSTFLTCRTAVAPAAPLATTTPGTAARPAEIVVVTAAVNLVGTTTLDPIDISASEVVARLSLTELGTVLEAFESSRQIVRDIDRQLLGNGRARLGRELTPEEKRRVRDRFLQGCRSRLPE